MASPSGSFHPALTVFDNPDRHLVFLCPPFPHVGTPLDHDSVVSFRFTKASYCHTNQGGKNCFRLVESQNAGKRFKPDNNRKEFPPRFVWILEWKPYQTTRTTVAKAGGSLAADGIIPRASRGIRCRPANSEFPYPIRR